MQAGANGNDTAAGDAMCMISCKEREIHGYWSGAEKNTTYLYMQRKTPLTYICTETTGKLDQKTTTILLCCHPPLVQLVAKVLAQKPDLIRGWSASVKWHGRSLFSCTCSICMRSRLSLMGLVSICVVLCCLAVEKSRGIARETEEAFLLLFKGVNAKNCQQAQMPLFTV